jgi:hypothetical protein
VAGAGAEGGRTSLAGCHCPSLQQALITCPKQTPQLGSAAMTLPREHTLLYMTVEGQWPLRLTLSRTCEARYE